MLPMSQPARSVEAEPAVPPWSVPAIAAAYRAARASGGAFGGTPDDPRRDGLPVALGAAAGPDPNRLVIEAVDVTGSTNADLLARARSQRLDDLVLRAALFQTDGRGRRGRNWLAPRGAGLWFSLALPLGTQVPVSGLTLACGVALAAELNALRAPVQLKWPNDLLLDERKLGGILTEVANEPSGSTTLVIGVGLNLFTTPPGAAASPQSRSSDPKTSGALEAVALDAAIPAQTVATLRDPLLGVLAAALVTAAESVQRAGFAPWRARFNALFAYLDRPATLVEAGLPTATGTVRGVDDTGRLMLQTPTGTRVYLSGDLSLRPLRQSAA